MKSDNLAQSGDIVISFDKISKVFSADEIDTYAVKDVSFNIRRGEFVAIAGPSGCGKSTLLSLLGLLDSVTSGKYMLNNQDVSSLNTSQRALVRNKTTGFIFQSFNLLSELTSFENVELPLTYRNEFSKAQRREMVMEVLEKVDISARAGHYPSQLSGGQQQRVAVARALIGEPSIILADEPTGNLDSTNAESVMDLLLKLHGQGSTICMVTHDPRSALVAERTIHMKDGILDCSIDNKSQVELVRGS